MTSGSIEITTPQLGELYDENLKTLELNYFVDLIGENDCGSDQLSDLTASTSEGKLSLTYSKVIGDTTSPVTIVCNNWRNPIRQEMLNNFGIKTFTA